MKTITELFEKWDSIAPYSGGFLLISDDHPLAFHIGIQGEREKVFVVLNTGKVEGIASSKAVSAENVKLESGEYALRFSLMYPSLDELFVKLCWDLMESSKDAADPLAQFIAQYKKWQRLLQRIGDGLLSSSVQKGLIGELLFLKERAKTDGMDAALKAWVGPEGADQDFNFESFWAEVKSTTIAGNTVAISSLQQLDRTDAGILVVYYMDRTTSKGLSTVSLASVVNEVEKLMTTEVQIKAFSCKLARLGFQDKDRSKYDTSRYRIAKHRYYSVTEEFPRLTKDMIPSGIVNAKYDLDLATISSFERQDI